MGTLVFLSSMIKNINSYYWHREQGSPALGATALSVLLTHVSTSSLKDSLPYSVPPLAKIFHKIITYHNSDSANVMYV